MMCGRIIKFHVIWISRMKIQGILMTSIGGFDGRSNENKWCESADKSGFVGTCGGDSGHSIVVYDRPENNCKRK